MQKEKLDRTTKIVLEKVKEIDKRYAKTVAVMGITIIVFAILYSLFMRKNVVIQPLLFVTEKKELKYVTVDSQTPKVITTIDGLQDVSFSNTSNKKLLYTLENATFLLDVLNNKSIPFGKNIVESSFSMNDKYIVYRTKEGGLKLYDFDVHKDLDQGVTKIICVTEKSVVYQKDKDLYIYEFQGKEGHSIAKNVEEVIYHASAQKLLYQVSKSDVYDYYVYTLKNNHTELILENVTKLFSYNQDFTKFLYMVKNKTTNYSKVDFLNDTFEESDAAFISYSVDDIISGSITYSEYLLNQKEKEAVVKRQGYRGIVDDYITSLEEFTLYLKENGQIQEITNHAYDVSFANLDVSIVVYKSYNFDKRLNIEEIVNEESLNSFLKELKFDYIYTKNALHNKTLLSLSSEKIEFYMTKNQDLYYNFQGDLYYLPFKGDEVLDEVLIDKNVSFLKNYMEFDKSLLYYAMDTKELKSVITNQKKTIDSNVTKIFHMDEKRKLFLYQTNEDSTSNIGTLKMYNHQKIQEIASDVTSIDYVNRNLIYITKKQASGSSAFDLYRYVGKKDLEKIDSNVLQVWPIS